MSLHPFSLCKIFLAHLFTISLIFMHPSTSTLDTFLYGGCSQQKYAPGTPYESNVNSMLSSLINSASLSNYNNFKVSLPNSSPNDVVFGLFQCRGDLSTSACRDCVTHSVSRLGILCPESTGGAVQLDGCFVKYDNISFLGVEDKSVVLKKCGPSIGYDTDTLSRRDGVLAYLLGEGKFFRVGGSGKVQGVAQCVQDLSVAECQDCVEAAAGELRSDCASAAWGDMFLGKCYVRYSDRSHHLRTDTNDETQKTLAILLGIIAGVALGITLLSGISKMCDDSKDGK